MWTLALHGGARVAVVAEEWCDAPPVAERPWIHEALSDESGDRALAVAVEHGVDTYVRAAPLWRSMHAAAISDPEVDAYARAMAAGRRAGMGGLVARLDSLGYLREGLTADRATGRDALRSLSYETHVS